MAGSLVPAEMIPRKGQGQELQMEIIMGTEKALWFPPFLSQPEAKRGVQIGASNAGRSLF